MLDTYFKEYFWTFHLAVLGIAGFLVANAINIFVGHALSLEPGAVATASTIDKKRDDSKKSTVPVSAILDKNIFDAETENPEALKEEAEAAEGANAVADADPNNCTDPSSIRVTLVGTNVVMSASGETSERSIAIFQNSAKGAAETYRIGEEIEGAKIIEIEWRRVLVSNNGRCEYFSLEEDQPDKPTVAAATPPPRRGGSRPPKIDFGEGIEKKSDTEFDIPRNEIDKVLGNLQSVATQARIVPSFQNGKPNGFKLFSIRPDSLYSKIGIQNGDIVQKINGYEINSPEKALEIYSKLKDASSITVDLVRRGRQQTMTYQIR